MLGYKIVATIEYADIVIRPSQANETSPRMVIGELHVRPYVS